MRKAGTMTVQRKTIYKLLTDADDHPTASDIMEKLKAEGYQFAYATVYNTLRYLTEEGLVRELKLEGDVSRYDARTDDHHHILCSVCGKVDEVYAQPPESWTTGVAQETGYELEDLQVLFKGVCPSCRDTKKTDS